VWYDRFVPRYPHRSPSSIGYAFGPGPITSAIKWIVIANTAAFLLTLAAPRLVLLFGLRPADVLQQYFAWQLVTYMFLHGDFFHILFNMLTVWMFGVELERMWGSRFFLQYYFVTGVGAALTTLIVSLVPYSGFDGIYGSTTIGASGAVYGILMAFAVYFPNRPILMFLLFPIPAKIFVMIFGAIALLSSINQSVGGTAHAAHLGGLVFGYLYLKRGRGGMFAELRYRWIKWKMNRLRRKFDVYSGGRGPGNPRVH